MLSTTDNLQMLHSRSLTTWWTATAGAWLMSTLTASRWPAVLLQTLSRVSTRRTWSSWARQSPTTQSRPQLWIYEQRQVQASRAKIDTNRAIQITWHQSISNRKWKQWIEGVSSTQWWPWSQMSHLAGHWPQPLPQRAPTSVQAITVIWVPVASLEADQGAAPLQSVARSTFSTRWWCHVDLPTHREFWMSTGRHRARANIGAGTAWS